MSSIIYTVCSTTLTNTEYLVVIVINNIMLTQEEIYTLFEYRDGILYWKVSRGVSKKGKIAGTLCDGYCKITFKKKIYFRSNLVWIYFHGELPDEEIDHQDRNRLNDNIKNLREASHAQQNYNKSKATRNKSGYKGVRKVNSKWVAYITVNKKQIILGRFDIKENAARAYDKAAREYFGEFAYTNFPI